MIALNETDPTAAEVPFYLPTTANPLVGLTLHDFSGNAGTGEVKLQLPSGSFFNVAGSQIVEKGFGWYAVRLTAGQTPVAGIVNLLAVVTGAQPDFVAENIGTAPGGDIAVLGNGYMPFFLPNASDPIFGAPITGHVFLLGEAKLCLPRASGFVNASLSDIVEFGNGGYALRIGAAQSVNRGKAFLHVDIGASSQPFGEYVTILGATSSGAVIVVGGGVSTPVVSPYVPSSPAYMDHAAGAINRLCEQFKAKAA